MRKYLFAGIAAAALAVVAVLPGSARASWLSQALHNWMDPDDYAPYYYMPPGYGAYPGYYGNGSGYGYNTPGYGYYGPPNYPPYFGSGYYRPWNRNRHMWHEWREHVAHGRR